jgi:hypothetical protein
MSSALTTDTPSKQKFVKRTNPSSNTYNTHSSSNKSAANHQTPYNEKSTDIYIDQEQISPFEQRLKHRSPQDSIANTNSAKLYHKNRNLLYDGALENNLPNGYGTEYHENAC